MLRASTLLTMGVAFTFGMVLGLMIHLPGTVHREHENGGVVWHSHVNKRSVLREKADVMNPNRPVYSAGDSIPGNRDSHVVFIRHINSDSVESKVNKSNNAKKRRKTNSKQLVATNKQIWRIKQAEIATLNSYDRDSRVEQTGVRNSERSSAEVSGRRTEAGLDKEKFPSSDPQRNGPTRQVSRQSTRDDPNDVQIIDQVENYDNVNKDSNMADAMSIGFTDLSDIVDGVFWSPAIESHMPRVTDKIGDEWSDFARNSRIVKMEEGCGRMQNRLITFEDSTKACARYRINTDQIQGDFFSFLLSLLLGLDNVPKSVLGQANVKGTQWKIVSPDIIGAQWNDEKIFVLSQFVPDLSSVYIPLEFRNKQSSLFPSEKLKNRTLGELYELAQWSDLILFDYLTGNLDRVVNNMFNQQWNRRMMEGPVHNLEKISSQGKLIFLDNESGLFHSYRLLDSYQHFHEQLLNSLCIFRRSTVDAIRTLRNDKNLGRSFMDLLRRREPDLHKFLPKIPQHNINILQERMQHILDHVALCEAKYGF